MVPVFNPLTTDDAFWHCQFLATLSVGAICLKIGTVLAERMGQGDVGGCTHLAYSTWWLLELPIDKPWSMLGGPFVCFLAQVSV